MLHRDSPTSILADKNVLRWIQRVKWFTRQPSPETTFHGRMLCIVQVRVAFRRSTLSASNSSAGDATAQERYVTGTAWNKHWLMVGRVRDEVGQSTAGGVVPRGAVMAAYLCSDSSPPLHCTVFLQLFQVLAMSSSSQQAKGRDRFLSTLDALIPALNLAKEACGIPPAQAAFSSVSILLTMIKVRFLLFNG